MKSVMILIAASICALITACGKPPKPNIEEESDFIHTPQGADNIFVTHDNARSVTCWHTVHGISCLPDSTLTSAKPTANTAPSTTASK